MIAYLERIEARENCYRFYRIELFENLFGDVQMDCEWGRLGQSSRTMISLYDDWFQAELCAHLILAQKVLRDYILVEYEFEKRFPLGMIPRSNRKILDLPVRQFFCGNICLEMFAVRLEESGIRYVGDFIQKQWHEIILCLIGTENNRKNNRLKIYKSVQPIQDMITNQGLSLNAKALNWSAPHNVTHEKPRRIKKKWHETKKHSMRQRDFRILTPV